MPWSALGRSGPSTLVTRYRQRVPNHMWWVLGVAVVVTLIASLTLAAVQRRRRGIGYGALSSRGVHRAPRDHFRQGEHPDPPPLRRAAIVVNPVKLGNILALRAEIAQICDELGWADPMWLPTTASDTGAGQALQAVADGADVVCAMGGDGTVRAVAAALSGTETPMALIPTGTTNLLARNLDLPLDSVRRLVEIALTGRNRRVDVGTLTHDVSGEDERPGRHLFLVMAGIGMDGEIMAETPDELKAKMGWPAYVIRGATKVFDPSFKVRVKLDTEPEFTRRTRSVLVGNCGRLTGNLVLMPDARIDDGTLDVAIISPRGPIGWAGVLAQTVTRSHKGHAIVEQYPCQEVTIRADRLTQVQVDGDTLGAARSVTMAVQPRALSIRVPQ